jgi:hypothetical protein
MIATILCQKLLVHPWIGNHLNVFMQFFCTSNKVCIYIRSGSEMANKPSIANSGKRAKEGKIKQPKQYCNYRVG